MDLKQTRLHILRNEENLATKAKTGISLHCHTEFSKEMLDFVPVYAEKMPIIAQFWRKEREKYQKKEGKFPDFSNAYWSPPLTPEKVHEIERNQINNAGLDAIVSLSDHDSVDGNIRLNAEKENPAAPISLEWTVPFDIGYFHVGVHNLPKDKAIELSKILIGYTFSPEEHSNEKLRELFAMLNDLPGVLVILNHPLWDIEMVGQARHELLLKDFIREHGRWIHAFEVNGFRSWSENKAVIEMAEALGLPLASGGDRHGCKPNTVVNLSNSRTFEEFAEEIRVDKRSEVVLMPAYAQPLHSRQMESFGEILSHYPEFPDGRQRWFDRVFFDTGDGKGVVSLSSHGWRLGGPRWLRAAIWTLGFLGSPTMRPVMGMLRKSKDRVPADVEKAKFEIPELEELLIGLQSDAIS